jgi:hypothetical protein
MRFFVLFVVGVNGVRHDPISVPLIPYVKSLKMPSFDDILNKQLSLVAHEHEVQEAEKFKYSTLAHREMPHPPPPGKLVEQPKGPYGNPAITDMNALMNRP